MIAKGLENVMKLWWEHWEELEIHPESFINVHDLSYQSLLQQESMKRHIFF